MPFKKGNNLGGGARNYVLEQKQAERMRKILDKDLSMIERIQSGKKMRLIDWKKLELLQARVLKIMDKLHASRGEMKHTGELVTITPEDQAAANKAILDYIKNKKK